MAGQGGHIGGRETFKTQLRFKYDENRSDIIGFQLIFLVLRKLTSTDHSSLAYDDLVISYVLSYLSYGPRRSLSATQ